FPPLVIRGKELQEKKVSLSANISSQYISALMMIAPSLPEGLEIELIGQVTSVPYIIMTLDLLKLLGIKGSFSNNKIFINNQTSVEPKSVKIESDWSSASYFYSLAAINENAEIKLSHFRSSSRQGDSCIADIYE